MRYPLGIVSFLLSAALTLTVGIVERKQARYDSEGNISGRLDTMLGCNRQPSNLLWPR